MIRSVNIIKFDTGKILIFPLLTIKDYGSISIPPYIVKNGITFNELSNLVIETLKLSSESDTRPEKNISLFDDEIVKCTEIKKPKDLYKNSLSIDIFANDKKYTMTPSINLGPRKGFDYTNDRIVLPINSGIEELAAAINEAFEKSS